MIAQRGSGPRPADSRKRGRRLQAVRRRGFAAALLLIATSTSAAPADTLTLGEARRLSPQQLATRLLGAAGAAGDYREAEVLGDGGGMIHTPGLNAIRLYKRPKSAGFDRLCKAEGVSIQFSNSRYDTPGDPPHRVIDFWPFTRFALLDGEASDRDCAALAPLAPRDHPISASGGPVLLAVTSDRSVDAAFALRAIAAAQSNAPHLGERLTCTVLGPAQPACADPARTLRDIPVDRIHYARVERCPDTPMWCASATWFRSRDGNETKQFDLLIHTDARQVDPPVDFGLVAVAIDAGTSVDD